MTDCKPSGIHGTIHSLSNFMRRLVRGIQGFSLILFIWISAEVIPFPPNLEALPSFFTLHLLTKIHPVLGLIPTVFFIVLALFCLAISLWPAMSQPIRRGAIGGVVFGFLGIPLYALFKGESWGSYLWSFHFFTWMGVNLWIWDADYFYATLLAGACFDLAAASQALAQGLGAIPQFYAPAVSSKRVIVLDVALALAVLFFWGVRFRRKTPRRAEDLGDPRRVVWRGEASS